MSSWTLRLAASTIRRGWGEETAEQVTRLAPAAGSIDPADVHAVGYELGALGHDLADVLVWWRLVAGHRWRRRSALLGRITVGALCTGWVDGALATRRHHRHVVPLEVLSWRLGQQAGSATASSPMALVVVALPNHVLDVHAAAVAHHVRQAFTGDESIARGRQGPLLVLARRDAALAGRTRTLIDRLAADPRLATPTPAVWVEPLGRSAASIDDHVRSFER